MTDLDDLEYRMRARHLLQHLLKQSQLEQPQMVPTQDRSLLDPSQSPPRWPSGLYSDFDAVLDGLCGLTVLAGPSGTGKSLWAMSCALENAMVPGTAVFYFDCENHHGEQARRAMHWFGTEPSFRANMASLALHFHWLEVLPGMTYRQLLHFAADRLLHDHERVLLVFDSMSSLSRMIPGRQLDTLSKLYVALPALVRSSGGRLRVLALSELNKAGDVKGLEGVYASDMALKLVREPDEGENTVRLHMLKNRGGQFCSDLGLYDVRAKQCRLMKVDYRDARNPLHPPAH